MGEEGSKWSNGCGMLPVVVGGGGGVRGVCSSRVVDECGRESDVFMG